MSNRLRKMDPADPGLEHIENPVRFPCPYCGAQCAATEDSDGKGTPMLFHRLPLCSKFPESEDAVLSFMADARRQAEGN